MPRFARKYEDKYISKLVKKSDMAVAPYITSFKMHVGFINTVPSLEYLHGVPGVKVWYRTVKV